MARRHQRERDDLDEERQQTRDWLTALDAIVSEGGPERAERLLRRLQGRAAALGVQLPYRFRTAYVNTIDPAHEADFPGNIEVERRLTNIIRWNAMAMVVRANRRLEGIGGHISTYMSASTLFEVGFNHFFRGRGHEAGGDQLYLQGHASPGVYARAFVEGRISHRQVENFRRELQAEGGLASYPHPWLMPDFWEFPTVSMGLAPVMAVYQARFNRYLENRGLAERTGRVWAVVGDGEMDEPESVGALRFAARERLDNLVFLVDCNLQRLDGPVAGNTKVIQELEALYRGAGWNVIKVLWGEAWDPLLEADRDGLLVDRFDDLVDGDFLKYVVEGGAYMRQHLFGDDPDLERLVSDLDDSALEELARSRGGHDIRKVHAAMRAATEEEGRPTVVLAQTIKGLGLGDAGEARNTAHQAKTLDEAQLRHFRDFLDVPIPDDRIADAPLYRPGDESEVMQYLRERTEELGGPVPDREVRVAPLPDTGSDLFATYDDGTDHPATTTMVLVRLLGDLLADDELGELIVPIIPDEARTFGVEALFPRAQIYSPLGQKYEPVDADALLTYAEAKDGQILEEGITEAGSMSSMIAAGTAYATHGINTIPFFFFYSMFGFQRIGDLIWAAADTRTRGFLIGATSGRTTLNGEGLQHQDGHSHLIAYTNPRVEAFDPAFGYEVAAIIEDGIQRMYRDGEDVMYYVTVANEAREQPSRPDGLSDDEILRGLYRYRASSKDGEVRRVQLLASGPLLGLALRAQRVLEDDFGVTADVWSTTSWKRIYQNAVDTERHNRLHANGARRRSTLEEVLGEDPGVVVAVSDYIRALPYSLARWMPGDDFVALGTDGLGRSDSREALRDFFEVDERWITHAALRSLASVGRYPEGRAAEGAGELGLDLDKPDPSKA